MISEHDRRLLFIRENCTLGYHDSANLSKISEADGLNISDKIVSRLYKFTLEKYKDVDFGVIPKSKGMITDFDEYKNLISGVELLRSLEAQSNEKIEQIDTLDTAIKNMVRYSREFNLSYKMDKALGIMIYEIITMAIVRSLSYMIGNAVMYVKDPTIKSLKSLFDGNEEDILIRNLKKFNKSVQSSDINKIFDTMLSRKGIAGETMASIAIVTGILMGLVPTLRELVYFYYNSKASFREFIKIQAETLKNNIYTLRNKSGVDEKVIERQENKLEKLNNLANKLIIDGEVSDKKTINMIKNEKKEIKSEDMPASIANLDLL